jgi:hypothetical protein
MTPKADSLKKISKIDKPLENMIKMRWEKTQINKIRNKNREITTNTKEIQGVIRDYFENPYSKKVGKCRRNGQISRYYDHPKLNQEDINHLNNL